MKKPKKISEKIIADNSFRKIYEREFEYENGKIGNFLISAHSGASVGTMVLPVNKDGNIIYLKEFRYGVEEFIYNFPIGVLDEGLSESDNCIKELKEETGYNYGSIGTLSETIVANYEKSKIKMFIALGCYKEGEQELEDGENIEVLKASKYEFESMIANGEVTCPLTISCYFIAKTRNLI